MLDDCFHFPWNPPHLFASSQICEKRKIPSRILPLAILIIQFIIYATLSAQIRCTYSRITRSTVAVRILTFVYAPKCSQSFSIFSHSIAL